MFVSQNKWENINNQITYNFEHDLIFFSMQFIKLFCIFHLNLVS
jgi:hypothetical protein